MNQQHEEMTAPQIRKAFGIPMYENLESLADQMLDREEERIRMERDKKVTENSTDTTKDDKQGDVGNLVVDVNSVEGGDKLEGEIEQNKLEEEIEQNKQDGEIEESVKLPIDQAGMQAEKEPLAQQMDDKEDNDEELVGAAQSDEPEEKKREEIKIMDLLIHVEKGSCNEDKKINGELF